ncbi:MAG TPA: SDR family oxidoreductase [Ohtaekwangia sp.]|uniref:SDR family oxidoreductase n=1 Tax=Ohtaekwangia sp. TaxID=2066019 RepID=UPI002F95EF66
MYIEQLFNLTNRVAVVTGGTGVLGSAMSKALAQAGVKVAILGRRKDAADALAAEIKKSGGTAIGISADVLQEQSLKEARKYILEQFGSIDILVNGAGGNMPGATIMPDKNFLDLRIDDFQKVVDLNLTGTVLPSQIFGEVMVEKKQGIIINISSMTAFRPLTRVVGYSAAKAAISNLTQWLAVEMAKKFGAGIRVNAIAPGFFLTEQNRTLLTNTDGSLTPRGESIIRSTPFGRFGEADELNGTLLWLCSDASKFVSGIVVPVDGGFSAFAGV